MSSFDLTTILQDAATGAQNFLSLATATTENTSAQNDITDIMEAQALEAQKAVQDISTVQQTAKLKTQQANLKVANVMGTNAQDTGWLIGEMGKRVIAADKEAQDALKVVREKQSLNFLDDPLGYLMAQATIDGDIQRYNTAVDASSLAKDTADKLEGMSQNSFRTQNAIEQNVTESTIKSAAILEGYKYGKDANEAALSGLRTNLQGMQQSMNATAQAIDMKFKGFSAVMQDKQYQNSLASLDIARKNFSLAEEAKKAKMDEDSLIAKFIQKGAFNMSGTQLPEARAKDYIALYKSGQPEVRAMFKSGLESYMISPDGNQSVISTSPFDAATAFGGGLVKNLPQTQKEVGDYLVQARQEFMNPAVQNKMNIDPKDKEGMERAFNQYIRNRAGAEARTGVGIYTPASLSVVANSNPNMAALPVWKNVLAPMAAAGVKLDNPELVIGAVTAAIQKGTLSYNDALGITTMYRAGVDMNNMSRNWIATGMPLGTGYVAKVGQYGSFGKVPVNLTDDRAVQTLLNKAAASGAAISQRKTMMTNLPGAQ